MQGIFLYFKNMRFFLKNTLQINLLICEMSDSVLTSIIVVIFVKSSVTIWLLIKCMFSLFNDSFGRYLSMQKSMMLIFKSVRVLPALEQDWVSLAPVEFIEPTLSAQIAAWSKVLRTFLTGATHATSAFGQIVSSPHPVKEGLAQLFGVIWTLGNSIFVDM